MQLIHKYIHPKKGFPPRLPGLFSVMSKIYAMLRISRKSVLLVFSSIIFVNNGHICANFRLFRT